MAGDFWVTDGLDYFSLGVLLFKNPQKPIASMFSHTEYLKAKRLLSHSGKYWPGRLHPSVQIHHNPIKLADFAIICRFPQSGSSKQIQPVLHKRVVASPVPHGLRELPKILEEEEWGVLQMGTHQRDGLQCQKQPLAELGVNYNVKHYNLLHYLLHNCKVTKPI